MARLVTKFKYLKPNGKLGGYVKYIATREGAKRIDRSFRLAPSSGKQRELIKKLLRDFPDAKDMHEYEDYLKEPNMGNASEFIGRVLEDNAHSVMDRKTYADYIATRPRAERFGSHGLFTDDGVEVNLGKVSEELNGHRGNVWTVILSLRREDAQRLGYDTGKRWRDMLRTQTQTLADNLKIPISNFRWYAAFHNESHHPHVHLIAYSKCENEGYLTEQGVLKLRSAFARDIFAQDLLCVYEKQIEHRDELRMQSKAVIADIAKRIGEEGYENKKAEELMKTLAARLSKTKGKKQYGYLKSDVKALVCSIVDEIARDGRIAKLYELWYEQREEITRTYTQELPARIPLSQNPAFKSVRNAVVVEAAKLTAEREPAAEEEEKPFPDIEPPVEEAERKAVRGRRSRKTMWEFYAWAKGLLDKEGADYAPNRAVSLLMESAYRGNAVAKYRLGKLFWQGDKVPKDINFALRWLEEAVNDGNEYAEYLLGKILTEGVDIERDTERGRNLLERSAEKQNKYAAYLLGKNLLNGEIFEKDIAEAVRYLQITADKNFMPAQYLLGKIYYLGEGAIKNVKKALAYLEQAARQGHPNAAYLLGKIYMTEERVKDIAKAISYLQAAAKDGNDFAEYRLGTFYLYGKDIPRNEDRAIEYLKSSAAHGNSYAKQLLVRIDESNKKFHAQCTETAVRAGVSSLFGSIGRILQRELEEKDGKIALTEKKLWQRIEEKKAAQGLKHG